MIQVLKYFIRKIFHMQFVTFFMITALVPYTGLNTAITPKCFSLRRSRNGRCGAFNFFNEIRMRRHQMAQTNDLICIASIQGFLWVFLHK